MGTATTLARPQRAARGWGSSAWETRGAWVELKQRPLAQVQAKFVSSGIEEY